MPEFMISKITEKRRAGFCLPLGRFAEGEGGE